MIKVTVLYNLPPGTNESEFLNWRMGEHNAANITRPGVVRAAFGRVLGTPALGPDRPASNRAPYGFITARAISSRAIPASTAATDCSRMSAGTQGFIHPACHTDAACGRRSRNPSRTVVASSNALRQADYVSFTLSCLGVRSMPSRWTK